MYIPTCFVMYVKHTYPTNNNKTGFPGIKHEKALQKRKVHVYRLYSVHTCHIDR